MQNFKEHIQSQIQKFDQNITLEKINANLPPTGSAAISPIRVLEYISKEYPGLWASVETTAVENQINPQWDKGILLPFAYWLPKLLDAKYPFWYKNLKSKNIPVNGLDFVSVCSIGTWRYTKGIYKLDDEIAKHFFVDETDIKIPSLLLERQPEWSIYVDTQNLNISLDDRKLIGFWSNLNCFPTGATRHSDNKTLNITPLFEDGVGYLLSAAIPLASDIVLSIEQSTSELVVNLSKEIDVDDNRK